MRIALALFRCNAQRDPMPHAHYNVLITASEPKIYYFTGEQNWAQLRHNAKCGGVACYHAPSCPCHVHSMHLMLYLNRLMYSLQGIVTPKEPKLPSLANCFHFLNFALKDSEMQNETFPKLASFKAHRNKSSFTTSNAPNVKGTYCNEALITLFVSFLCQGKPSHSKQFFINLLKIQSVEEKLLLYCNKWLCSSG